MWKPRFLDSSCVRHSRSTVPSACENAWKEERSTAVGDWMVDIELDELFRRFGSDVVEELTVAVFVEVEAELNVVALTLIVMTAVLPTLRLPSVQVTVVTAMAQEPWLVNDDV